MKIKDFTKYAIATILVAGSVTGAPLSVFAEETLPTINENEATDKSMSLDMPAKHEDTEMTKEFFTPGKDGKITFDVACKYNDQIITKETYHLDANFRDALEGYEADDPFYAISKVMNIPDGYKLKKYSTCIILGEGVTTSDSDKNTVYYELAKEDENVDTQKSHYYFHDKSDKQLASVWIEYQPGMSNESTWRLLSENCPKGTAISDYTISSIVAGSDNANDDYVILKLKDSTSNTPSIDQKKDENNQENQDSSSENEKKDNNTNNGTVVNPPASNDNGNNNGNASGTLQTSTEKGNYSLTFIYLDRDGNEVGRQAVNYSVDGYNEDTYTFKKDSSYTLQLPDGYALDDDQVAPDSVEVNKNDTKEVTLRVHKMTDEEKAALEHAEDQPNTGVKSSAGGYIAGITAAGSAIVALMKKRKK